MFLQFHAFALLIIQTPFLFAETNIGVIVGVAVGVSVLAIVLLFMIFWRRKYLIRSRKPAKEFEKQESGTAYG